MGVLTLPSALAHIKAGTMKAICVSTPGFAAKHFKSELVKYAALVEKAGVVPQ